MLNCRQTGSVCYPAHTGSSLCAIILLAIFTCNYLFLCVCAWSEREEGGQTRRVESSVSLCNVLCVLWHVFSTRIYICLSCFWHRHDAAQSIYVSRPYRCEGSTNRLAQRNSCEIRRTFKLALARSSCTLWRLVHIENYAINLIGNSFCGCCCGNQLVSTPPTTGRGRAGSRQQGEEPQAGRVLSLIPAINKLLRQTLPNWVTWPHAPKTDSRDEFMTDIDGTAHAAPERHLNASLNLPGPVPDALFTPAPCQLGQLGGLTLSRSICI